MEGTCNECVFPLNKNKGLATCPSDTSLIYAAGEGKLSCVKELIAAGADVNTGCDCHGNGALLSAAANGHFHFNCVKELLDSGAFNVQNKEGFTALMFVKDVECLIELIVAGADVNAQNVNKVTL